MIDGLRRKTMTSRRARASGVVEPQMLSLEHEVDGGLRLMDVIVDPTSPTPEEASVSTAAPTVQAALAPLPYRHHRVLVLRFLDARPRQEIAAVEGISVGRLAEIEKRFRDRLRPPRQRQDTVETPSDQLTEKELTVLRLAAEGASAEETARWLRRRLETPK